MMHAQRMGEVQRCPVLVNARLQWLYFLFLTFLPSSISTVLLVVHNLSLSLLTELEWGLSICLVFVLTFSEKLPGTRQPTFYKADYYNCVFQLLSCSARLRLLLTAFSSCLSDSVSVM